MRSLKLFFTFFVILWITNLEIQSQDEINTDYFKSPIKHELRLAGTFGELRSNHFHMGIDIKSSKGVSGDSIFSVADGFISRIKVSGSGYGYALYIEHPNGYTSVYGHMKNYNEDIEGYILKEQHAKESFEIDVLPDPLTFPLKQGDYIGNIGNSGRSAGPHLHFELRETKTDSPINPLKFGIKTKDTIKPIISNLKFFFLDNKLREITSKSFKPSLQKNKYVIKGDTILLGAWRVGLGITAFDPMNSNANKNGIYKLEMFVNDEESYKIIFDSISYEHSRFINAYIDYKHFKQSKKRIQRCYNLPGNEIPFIQASENSIIPLFKDKAQKVKLIASDFHGNKSEMLFWIKRDEDVKIAKQEIVNYFLNYQEANIIDQNDLKIIFPENTLYEDLPIYISESEEKSANYCSNIFHIGSKDTPIHRFIKIIIKPSLSLTIDRSKVCLVNCDDETLSSYGGKWDEDHFIANVSELGSYALMIDTIPPTIIERNKKINYTNKKSISFRIDDNLTTAGSARGLKYNGFINGKWALFEYDQKNKKITHEFVLPNEGLSHTLTLTVEDDRGNKAFLEKKFTR